MKRRRFLQGAATVAAVAIVEHAPAAAWAAGPADGPRIEMLLERVGGRHCWILNGRNVETLKGPLLQPGLRYRMVMLNATGSDHTLTLPRHHFELRRMNQVPVSGICQDRVRLERYNVVEADLVLTRPAAALISLADESVILTV